MMRFLIPLLILGAVLSGCTDDPVAPDSSITFLRGDIEARGQDELEQLRGLERVEGSLHVWGAYDLSPLEHLVEVTETFELFGLSATNLNALDAFMVGRDVMIVDCPYLSTLSPALSWDLRDLTIRACNGLVEVSAAIDARDVEISFCRSLRSIDGIEAEDMDLIGLPSLERISESVKMRKLLVEDCGSPFDLGLLANCSEKMWRCYLRDLDGVADMQGLPVFANMVELHLEGMPDLRDLTGLSGNESIGFLGVIECSDLVSLSGIEALPNLQTLHINYNHALESMAGLGLGLGGLNTIMVYGNSVLTDVSALAEQDLGTDISIQQNAMLMSLEALSGHQRLETLNLSGFQTLTDFSGLTDVPLLKKLEIDGFEDLESLSGLESIVELDDLELESLPSLEQIDLPLRFTSLANLRISDCDQLGSCDGLDHVTWVASLYIDHNDGLMTLSGLDALVVVSRLSINLNPLLSQCEIDVFADQFELASYDWWGNGPCVPPAAKGR